MKEVRGVPLVWTQEMEEARRRDNPPVPAKGDIGIHYVPYIPQGFEVEE